MKLHLFIDNLFESHYNNTITKLYACNHSSFQHKLIFKEKLNIHLRKKKKDMVLLAHQINKVAVLVRLRLMSRYT